MLAGGMAMMIALLAMQLISQALGPHPMLTQSMTGMTMRRLIGFSGEFSNFLLSGPRLNRITITLLVIFLITGAGLGNWANQNPGQLNQRVMQAAAILFFVTITLIYLGDSRMLEYYLQEILLTLALSFLAYAVVLHRLLEPSANQTRWKIAGTAAVFGLILILRETWFP